MTVQGLSHVNKYLNVYQAYIACLFSRKLLHDLLVAYCILLSRGEDVPFIVCGPLYKNEDLSSEHYAMTEMCKLINKTMHEFLLALRILMQ